MPVNSEGVRGLLCVGFLDEYWPIDCLEMTSI